MKTSRLLVPLIDRWIATLNAHDTEAFLACFAEGAVLDDPSVGETFKGKAGLRRYFEAYFIGYQTQTRLVRSEVRDGGVVHLDVHFTGNFPGGQTGGVFDVTLEGGKIVFVHADLAQ